MGASPSRNESLSEQVRLGIYFDRDSAGLSNLRLQLESLLAICKAFGRFLVLPPPQTIQHLKEPYHESQFWSMSHLSCQVPIVLSSEKQPPDNAFQVKNQLASFHLQELPRQKHWFFSKECSRIQHFETLHLPDNMRDTAIRCVFESFELNEFHHAAAIRILKKINLEKYEYVAVHLRRGDFQAFRPQGQKSGEDISRSLEPYVSGKFVLIASDASKQDVEIEKLKVLAGAKQTLFLSEIHEDDASLLVKAAVEMLLCRWSNKFLGTHDSTFTNGIFSMRKKDSRTTRKELDATPLLVLDAKPTFSCDGVCWNKVTEYHGAPWF